MQHANYPVSGYVLQTQQHSIALQGIITNHSLLLLLAYDYYADMLFVYACDGDDRVLRAINDNYTIQAISNINETKKMTTINSSSVYICFRYLLVTGAGSIDSKRYESMEVTPLMAACFFHRYEVAELLLRHLFIDVNMQRSTRKDCALAILFGMNKLFRDAVTWECYMIKKERIHDYDKFATNINTNTYGERLYHNSSAVNEETNERTVKLLLSDPQTDVNIQRPNGFTPLMDACSQGRSALTRIVKLLLAHKDTDVNKSDVWKQTALSIATEKNCSELVALLLCHRNIDVNAQDENEQTALIKACYNVCPSIVRMLISHTSIKVNIQDYCKQTALMVACIGGNAEVVELLLSHKDIDVNMQDHRKQSALIHACSRNFPEVVRLLLHHEDIDVNLQNMGNQTALMCACKYSASPELVRLLLSRKDVDVQVMNSHGQTALTIAHKSQATEIFALLLDYRTADQEHTKDGNNDNGSRS